MDRVIFETDCQYLFNACTGKILADQTLPRGNQSRLNQLADLDQQNCKSSSRFGCKIMHLPHLPNKLQDALHKDIEGSVQSYLWLVFWSVLLQTLFLCVSAL